MNEYAIHTNGLNKNYGRYRGIVELNLSVERGDFFGYIGPNGAGKSTTIRSLLGLIMPDSGEAEVLGIPVLVNGKRAHLPKEKKSYVKANGNSDMKTILKKIGYMPSESSFYDRMSVQEIIEYAAKLHGKDCSIRSRELVDRLGLDTRKKVSELSLGNKKKVSIVCALQHEPELLILDEPTSGLDPLIQKEFFSILLEENKKGVTVFFSSHVLSEIERYCRHAAIIKDGSIIRTGTVEELAASNVKKVHVVTDKGEKEFLYKDSINELIKELGQEKILDLTIGEPSLDEVVLQLYEK